ncbi:DUF1449 domain-containing protein [Stieleria varia]|uniref:Uncharacterized protein n=1 Tax=Stieleria varia TaxID=2528005 RepID=A0A5C6AZY0_9BACT|nr:DUF1449 domain-containing protein [Stieleria varia]TWU05523.1 hypothetical protein Pla52n_12370 [Stieleria varia]
MENLINEFNELMFVGPLWPASLLVCMMVIYAMIAALGFIDLGLDGPDIDLDAPGLDVPEIDVPEFDVPDLDVPDVGVGGGDVDISHPSGLDFLSGIGATSIRLTNFGRVPLIIWAGVFTLAFWIISYAFWHNFDVHRYSPTWVPSILLAIRNWVLAIIVTKAVTQPVVGKFAPEPGYDKDRLLGATCEIWSYEATPTFGQAKFRTNASPLLLNVRTDGPTVTKGTEVRIIDFDPLKRVYTVSNIQPEKQS